MFFKVTFSGPVPSIAKRRHNEIKKGGWHAMGTHWHRHFRARHFTRRGAQIYDYTPRAGENLPRGSKSFKRSYTGRKWKEKHHTNPLVWSGDSERMSKVRDVRATSKGCRVVMHVTGLNRQNPNSKVKPNEELRRVTPAETATLARRFQTHYERKMRRIPDKQTIRIGS